MITPAGGFTRSGTRRADGAYCVSLFFPKEKHIEEERELFSVGDPGMAAGISGALGGAGKSRVGSLRWGKWGEREGKIGGWVRGHHGRARVT